MQQPPNYPNYGGWQQQPQQTNTQYPPQPGYPPQQWQQPPMIPPAPPPRPPKKKANPWLILGIILGGILIIGAISNATKSSPSTQATPTTISQATATPAPTDTPTPTPKPHIIPTRAQVDNLVKEIDPTEEMTVASYTEKSAALVLQMIFGYKVVVSQDVAKSTMQDIQIKVWRQGLYFSSVTVNIYQYQQNGPNKKIAYSVLTDQTASTIDFNFAPDLWEKYDQKWIDPHLEG